MNYGATPRTSVRLKKGLFLTRDPSKLLSKAKQSSRMKTWSWKGAPPVPFKERLSYKKMINVKAFCPLSTHSIPNDQRLLHTLPELFLGVSFLPQVNSQKYNAECQLYWKKCRVMKSKPLSLFLRRKCTNEVTDSLVEKPQDFINHTKQ